MSNIEYADLDPIVGELKYVDWEPETGGWGVFGTESGFCYSVHERPEDAESKAK